MLKARGLSHGAKATLFNIGWLSVDRIVRMGGSLAVGTLVARYLQPTAFGLFSLALAIYMLFNTASNLGLDYLVVRDLVREPDQSHEVLGTAFWLKGGASILTTAFAVLFTYATHPGQTSLVWMVAILSIAAISQAFDVIDFFFQARTLSKWTVIPRLIPFLLVNLARVAAIYEHAGLMVFVEIAASEIILSEVALLVSYLLFPHGLPRWRAHLPRSRDLLQAGWPMMFGSLLFVAYMRTDQILLGYFLGDKYVGYYSAAVRLSEIWYAIPVLICNSVMPRLLKLFTENRDLYYRRLQHLYNGLALLSVSLALVTQVSSSFVVKLLFGQAYLPAAHVLNIHIWTSVFFFIGALSGQQLVHENLTMLELRRMLAGALVNILLNLLLIPRFGIAGSAYATLIAYAVSCYLSDLFNRRTHHMFRIKSYALSGVWLFRDVKWWPNQASGR
jgi:PST family polysaccharide transporter